MDRFVSVFGDRNDQLAEFARDVSRKRINDVEEFNELNTYAQAYGRGVYFTDFIRSSAENEHFDSFAIASGTSNNPTSGFDSSNHVGLIRLISSASVNSGRTVRTTTGALYFAGEEQFDCIFYLDALTNVTIRVGFHDSTDHSDAVDGAYFEIASTGVTIGKTSNNSVRSSTATIATLTTGVWYHARVVVNNDATEVLYYLYDDSGTLLGSSSLSTNIPTSRAFGAAFNATDSAGGTKNLAVLDFIGFKMNRKLVRGAFR